MRRFAGAQFHHAAQGSGLGEPVHVAQAHLAGAVLGGPTITRRRGASSPTTTRRSPPALEAAPEALGLAYGIAGDAVVPADHAAVQRHDLAGGAASGRSLATTSS